MAKGISIGSRKNKARKLQNWVCQRIAEIFDVEFDNTNDDSQIQSRPMGKNGTDIILRGELKKRFRFDVECKNTEKINIYDAIEQAINNTEPGRNWLVVHKKNRSEPVVIMDWMAFENLIKKGLL